MKVLLLTTHLNLGGIGIYTTSLARSLKASGDEVTIASSGGELVNDMKREGISHIEIPVNTSADIGLHTIAAYLKLLPVVNGKPIDIIHAQTRVTEIIAHMLSKKSKAAFVATCHGFFKRRFLRRIFPCWGDYTIAISDAVRQHLVCDFKVPKERVGIIYNGIDMERFKRLASARDKLHIKKEYGLTDHPVVGIISRLSGIKGHRYLIGAFAKALKRIPDIQLLIIGDGRTRYKKGLERQAELLGITQRVKFHCACKDTSIPLSVIDVFCHPSLQEGLGLSILEAMAMEVPVVASDVGGIYTLIKDRSNGLLVPPRDEEALSEAIISILSDKAKASAMAKLSKAAVKEKFTLEAMTKRVSELYKKALKPDSDGEG